MRSLRTGEKGGYDFFTGRDASRAYLTGKFKDDLNDDVEDFTDEQFHGLMHWKDFYLKVTPLDFPIFSSIHIALHFLKIHEAVQPLMVTLEVYASPTPCECQHSKACRSISTRAVWSGLSSMSRESRPPCRSACGRPQPGTKPLWRSERTSASRIQTAAPAGRPQKVCSRQ